jgi:hypothetical protein
MCAYKFMVIQNNFFFQLQVRVNRILLHQPIHSILVLVIRLVPRIVSISTV